MIRPITKQDKELYLRFAEQFYHSSAVSHTIPTSHILLTFEELMKRNTYAEGFIIEKDGIPAGYALLAKTFSQEAGGMVLWLEELFISEPFRKMGLGTEFLTYFTTQLNGAVSRERLEIEPENHRAKALYEKYGFRMLEYGQMYKGK